MCGFETGLGKYMNDKIIKHSRNSLEIIFKRTTSSNNSSTASQSESQNQLIICGHLGNRKSFRKGNCLAEFNLESFSNQTIIQRNQKVILSNLLITQMIFTQKKAMKISLSDSKFFLISENKRRIYSGIELLFISSLVFVKTKNSNLEEVFTFAYVQNFDDHYIYLLSCIHLPSENNQVEITKSSHISLNLEVVFNESVKSEGLNTLHPVSSISHQGKATKMIYPFQGLELSKKVSTKLRKKISKRNVANK